MALFLELKKHYNDYEMATFVLDGVASQKTETVAKDEKLDSKQERP